MQLGKSNPIFPYIVIGPELGIFPEGKKIEAAINNQVSASSTGQTRKQCWELLGKQKTKWIVTIHKSRMCLI